MSLARENEQRETERQERRAQRRVGAMERMKETVDRVLGREFQMTSTSSISSSTGTTLAEEIGVDNTISV